MQRFPAEKSKWVSQRWNGRGKSDHLCLLLQMKKDLCPRTPSSHAYVPGRGKTVSVVSPAFSPSRYQRASFFQKEEEGRYLYSLVTSLDDEKRLIGPSPPWELSLEKGFLRKWKHFYLPQTGSGVCEKQGHWGLVPAPYHPDRPQNALFFMDKT